jgi:hypothetical protein
MTRVPTFNRENQQNGSLSDWELLASPGPGRWAGRVERWVMGVGSKTA